MKKLLSALMAIFVLVCFTSCGQTQGEGPGGSTKRTGVKSEELQFADIPTGSPVATFSTSKGDFYVVLYPEYAPLAVENFTALAEDGYYNKTIFHRVVNQFIIQGGDATQTGKGGKSIWVHPFNTERADALRHYTGALCMASDQGKPDTHTSQFYVVTTLQDGLDEEALQTLQDAGLRDSVVSTYKNAGGAPYLDNTDTVFGQVYAGMDVVDTIAGSKTDNDGRPTTDIVLESVTLSTYTPPETDEKNAQSARSEVTAPASEVTSDKSNSDSSNSKKG